MAGGEKRPTRARFTRIEYRVGYTDSSAHEMVEEGRSFDDELTVGREIGGPDGRRYRVTRPEQPASSVGIGHAWCAPA